MADPGEPILGCDTSHLILGNRFAGRRRDPGCRAAARHGWFCGCFSVDLC
jgi:hypothetical protein